MVRFHVSAGHGAPIYRQIIWQVIDATAAGQFKPGDQLSSQRELAKELVVSPLTVKKAYDELERRGYVVSRQGRGTFVHDRPPRLNRGQKCARMTESVRRLVNEAELVGLSLRELVELVRAEKARLRAKRERARS